MKIINNYEGSSIDVISIKDNIANLSLRKEAGQYEHYYNFKVINDSTKTAFIYLENIEKTPYFRNEVQRPYINKAGVWQLIDNKHFTYENGKIMITIEPQKEIEISLYPRYTVSDLDKYLSTLPKNKNLKIENINNTGFKKIIIGDMNLPLVVVIGRQHPAEVYSSYFIEAMINSLLENKEPLSKYCFVFYPIVNVLGVNNGNHRYTNNIDYNRIWNRSGLVFEIDYIKNDIMSSNLAYFIDVHGDEVSKINYVRTNYKLNYSSIGSMQVLKDPSKFRRLSRALIKQRKLINLKDKTAREYISDLKKCRSILVELSLKDTIESAYDNGSKLVKSL